MYVEQKHLNKLNWILLEIKLPREITKSPFATELAITSLLQAGGITGFWKQKYMGALPAFSSLEIASIEGKIHFYVRVQKKFKAIVEGGFYAQYPGIEIVEADDYTSRIYYHHLSKTTAGWGATYGLTKTWNPVDDKTGIPYHKDGEKWDEKEHGDKDKLKMPADFLPLATYVDFGLDKDPKDEYKVDPLASIIEIMGQLGKGEHFWYQVILQDEAVYNGSKRPQFYVNKITHKHVNLSDMAKSYIKQLRTGKIILAGTTFKDEFGSPKMIDEYNDDLVQQFKIEKDKDGKDVKVPNKVKAVYKETKFEMKKDLDLNADEKAQIEAITKKMSKPLMIGCVRLMYVTEASKFNAQHINTIVSFGKHFGGVNSLGMKALADPYDYPWENIGNRRVPWRTEELFEAYVEREAFFPHIEEREFLDKWEDTFFWTSSLKTRKLFRMMYEAIFHPFDHPSLTGVSTYNLEEIATLWHLPGAHIQTPTLPRIDTTKGIAPSNLPV
jgi:hypothetical protein